MENIKQIIVTGIKWDAPKSAGLPKKVVIDINEDNEYLLEDIDGYADELCDYLSDEYEYCIERFNVECKRKSDFIRRYSMKFSLIKDWQNKGLKCNFCGTTKSVKYSVSMNGAVVCSCNKCVLKYSK